ANRPWPVAQSPRGGVPFGHGPRSTGSASPIPPGTVTLRPSTSTSRCTWSCRITVPIRGATPARAMRASGSGGSPQGAGPVRGAGGGDGATSAHGSSARACARAPARTYDGASRRPGPSVVANGTRFPVAQYQTWCPPNATLPVVVSTVYAPESDSVAERPLEPLRSVIVAPPPNAKRSAVVPTPSAGRLRTVTSSGKPQRRVSTVRATLAEGAAPSATPAATPAAERTAAAARAARTVRPIVAANCTRRRGASVAGERPPAGPARAGALGRERREPFEPAREVPVALAEELHRGGHEHGSHHGRVDEHGDRQAEAHQLHHQQAERREQAEDRDHDHRGARHGAGRARDREPHRVVGRGAGVVQLLDAAQDEDVVVHREPEEDDEQEERKPAHDRPVRLEAERPREPAVLEDRDEDAVRGPDRE